MAILKAMANIFQANVPETRSRVPKRESCLKLRWSARKKQKTKTKKKKNRKRVFKKLRKDQKAGLFTNSS